MIQTHYAKFLKNELIKVFLLRGYYNIGLSTRNPASSPIWKKNLSKFYLFPKKNFFLSDIEHDLLREMFWPSAAYNGKREENVFT